ncbi:sugar phosphate isomerase/epimerase family protein [Alicyclobacillus fastidiosus]|uniref:TIM barrel protein n=1 Tax=Alicyclobacillus fastidiosus TaxID=392011 RepID=A0ABV5AG55_9BACL|nr:TIM barrel protein [Alicyclobacillus fastidiosus]WEH08882.1 TIM barrel protein [Alicyclobacillus fastidiosus]
MTQVYVSASIFPTSIISQSGHTLLAEVVAKAGADGIEVRDELLNRSSDSLDEIAATCQALDMDVVFSTPTPMFLANGQVNPTIQSVFEASERLQAKVIKMNLGGFEQVRDPAEGMAHLQAQLGRLERTTVTIENDQRQVANQARLIENFLTLCTEYDVPIHLTFDMGNWVFVGERMQDVAPKLMPFIRYVHVKDSELDEHGVRQTIPLDLGSPAKAADIHLLQQMTRRAPICIEYPMPWDAHVLSREVVALKAVQMGGIGGVVHAIV